MTVNDRLLTTEEVAEMWGMSMASVNRWARQRLIPHMRLPGGQYRFWESQVREQIQNLTTEAKSGD